MFHSIGLWSQRVGELWIVYQVTGSGVSLGLATALRTIPSLCMGPLAGVLADRHNRKRLLQVTHIIKMLLAAIFWAVAKYSNPDMLTLYALILLVGLITTFDAPIRRGFVRVIVPSDLLSKAASLHTAVISIGRILGPAIGGMLIVLSDTSTCFLANSVCAFFCYLLLYRIKSTELRSATNTVSSYGFGAAISYAWGATQVRVPLIYLAIACIAILNLEVVFPILVEETLGGGSTTFSVLLVFLSIGNLLGSLAAAEKQEPDFSFHWILLGFSLAVGLLSWAPNTLLVLVALIPIGFLSGLFLGNTNAKVQAGVAPEYHGRIVAIYAMIFVGMRSIGSVLVGILTEVFNAQWALRLSAFSNVFLVLIATIAMQSFRRPSSRL